MQSVGDMVCEALNSYIWQMESIMNIFDALLTHNWLRDFYYSYGSCKRPYAVVEAISDLQYALFKAKVVFEK